MNEYMYTCHVSCCPQGRATVLPDHHPNSRRFWRLNSIMGLRVMLGNLSPYSYAADPEALAAHRAYERELAVLLRRENAVQARARRIGTPTP
jgi:hypothetical protein